MIFWIHPEIRATPCPKTKRNQSRYKVLGLLGKLFMILIKKMGPLCLLAIQDSFWSKQLCWRRVRQQARINRTTKDSREEDSFVGFIKFKVRHTQSEIQWQSDCTPHLHLLHQCGGSHSKCHYYEWHLSWGIMRHTASGSHMSTKRTLRDDTLQNKNLQSRLSKGLT